MTRIQSLISKIVLLSIFIPITLNVEVVENTSLSIISPFNKERELMRNRNQLVFFKRNKIRKSKAGS